MYIAITCDHGTTVCTYNAIEVFQVVKYTYIYIYTCVGSNVASLYNLAQLVVVFATIEKFSMKYVPRGIRLNDALQTKINIYPLQ